MKPSNASPAFSGISILCIDNHIDSLEILRVTLQLEGANVLTATSAREALFSLKQSGVDVVLCDLRMPDENGVETLHKLRAAGFDAYWESVRAPDNQGEIVRVRVAVDRATQSVAATMSELQKRGFQPVLVSP